MSRFSPPVPDADEIRDNAVFDALMWAAARPGLQARIPAPGGLLPIALAFIDIDNAIYCDNSELREALSYTGASQAEISEADHVFVAGELTVAHVESLRRGSALYPDQGATIVVEAPLAGGRPLRLTGPGIENAHTIAPVIPAEIWPLRARAIYPRGFELIIVDGNAVIALPRSTRVEIC